MDLDKVNEKYNNIYLSLFTFQQHQENLPDLYIYSMETACIARLATTLKLEDITTDHYNDNIPFIQSGTNVEFEHRNENTSLHSLWTQRECGNIGYDAHSCVMCCTSYHDELKFSVSGVKDYSTHSQHLVLIA